MAARSPVVEKVNIDYLGRHFSLGANNLITIPSFLEQATGYVKLQLERSMERIDPNEWRFTELDGSLLSPDDKNLGELLSRINTKQPMNPPILSLNLERRLQITIRQDFDENESKVPFPPKQAHTRVFFALSKNKTDDNPFSFRKSQYSFSRLRSFNY